MSTKDFRREPVDQAAVERLHSAGLRMDLLDAEDTAAAGPTLVAAGRIGESTAGAAALADGLLRSEVTPFLSIWY